MSFKFSELTFTPKDRMIDLDGVISYISKIPFTVESADPKFSFLKTYIVSPNQEVLDYCLQYKEQNNVHSPSSTLIIINEKYKSIGVGLYSRTDDGCTKKAVEFILWLLSQYDCAIVDGEGYDWTKDVRENGAQALFE